MVSDSEEFVITELKLASKEVVKTIVDIWEEVINWHSSFDSDFALDKDGRSNFGFMVSKAIHDPTQTVYIAKKDNEIIGFVFGYVKKHSGFFKNRIIAHISDIAVVKQYRRTGVGTALMQKFEKGFAKQNDANELSLYVHSQNKEGVDFYNKLGFDIKLLSMRKKL
ncbi:MAG: GNAT family N-acetyltransferase [Candidatus Heimdallarchaeota archaeon]|nr:GNAT family N-acetyltransferase [Candidatus Heimdallarchaeota archaeon]